MIMDAAPELTERLARKLARKVRLAMVMNVLKQDLISLADAKEILSGCLTPDDESTRADDRDLLFDLEAIKKIDEDDK